jgi:hypothetical protein
MLFSSLRSCSGEVPLDYALQGAPRAGAHLLLATPSARAGESPLDRLEPVENDHDDHDERH